MKCLAVVNDILGLSPLEKTADKIEKIRRLSLCHCQSVRIYCLGLASFSCEQIDLITRPSAREIHSESAMVSHILQVGRYKHKFITCKHLRYSSHCSHHDHRKLETCRVLAYNVTYSGSVMISSEYHHLRKVMIYKVM